uniref:protein GLUTAMINE DUMPER 5-like n=1 Tax=Erigeron canadensis TaxID=72917 RepID=UPI001CB95BE8|nr:protein GLUTAMINE DUMPER 5-like [Erigeron canadensis]
MTLQSPSLMAPTSPVIVHQSPWHSPVPYLFGGLAAVLSLIAFALVVLACSYSKHSRDHDNDAEGEQDLEAGGFKPNYIEKDLSRVFEENYLVIMAGQANPTFLATPVSSRPISFCSCSCRGNSLEESVASEFEKMKKEKQGSDDQLQA